MSRTLKDKTQYTLKSLRRRAETGLEATQILKSISTKESKKKGLKSPYSKPFTKDDLAFRNMDPAFKEWWKHHDEQYDRDNGLDWWLEFGFPSWSEALGVFSPVVVDIKLRSVLLKWVF